MVHCDWNCARLLVLPACNLVTRTTLPQLRDRLHTPQRNIDYVSSSFTFLTLRNLSSNCCLYISLRTRIGLLLTPVISVVLRSGHLTVPLLKPNLVQAVRNVLVTRVRNVHICVPIARVSEGLSLF